MPTLIFLASKQHFRNLWGTSLMLCSFDIPLVWSHHFPCNQTNQQEELLPQHGHDPLLTSISQTLPIGNEMNRLGQSFTSEQLICLSTITLHFIIPNNIAFQIRRFYDYKALQLIKSYLLTKANSNSCAAAWRRLIKSLFNAHKIIFQPDKNCVA